MTGTGVADRSAGFSPWSALAPEMVVRRLAHQLFGTTHEDWARTVLDYHGLDGRPAEPLATLAKRHGISIRTASGRIHHLRAAAVDLDLDSRVILDATRNSTPTEDHLSRVRIATTLHLPVPGHAPAPSATVLPPPMVSASHHAAGRAAVRLLATVGPLDLDSLFAAIGRCRRFRVRDPLSRRDLVAALDAIGATRGEDLHWRAPAGVSVPERYRTIVESARGRDLTRQQMIGILLAAGYSMSSASGRMSSSHPLFERTGPDHYRIIGAAVSSGHRLRQRVSFEC